MLRFADMKIRPKLIFLFIMTGIIPLAIASFVVNSLTTEALMEKSFNQLLVVQEIRKEQIEDTLRERLADVRILAESQRIKGLYEELSGYFGRRGVLSTAPVDTGTKEYQAIAKKYAAPLKDFLEAYGYHDLMLISAKYGHVVFALSNTGATGTNLRFGPYRDSGLATLWHKVMETGETAFVDFDPYEPGGGAEAAFVGHPIKDESGKIIGVAVLQLDPSFITRIMDSRQGMGETGESYLLHWFKDADVFELRSNITSMGDGRYSVGFALDRSLEYWKDAVSDRKGTGHKTYLDSAGNEVLVAYDKLDVPGIDWYLFSKIDRQEVTAPIRATVHATLGIAGILVAFIALGSWSLSRSLTRPILEDMAFAEAIADGKFDSELTLERRDELGELAQTLNRMARDLRAQDWLKSGKETLNDELRGEMSPDELARRFITFIVKHMNAQLGALYLSDGETLDLRASYAFTDRKGNFNRFRLGEGLVGQAALENEVIIFSDVTEDAPALNYGAGEKTPANFMIVPVSFEGELIGVFLVGAVSPFTELQRDFVKQNTESLAIFLNAAKSRQTIRELLEKAQLQQEELRVANEELEEQTRALRESEAELQAQQEELRVTNEELEEQTQALKESEKLLQAQQEELRVTNEELEERTEALEQQKEGIRRKNAELVKAQEAVRQKARDLELASRYKSEFLANMSHELRTPLNSILILSQLFANNRDGNLSEKQVESAKAIHSSGSDLLALINDILDLSKVEAGKVELVLEDVHLDAMIGDLNRVFRDVAADKGLGFRFDIADGLPPSLYSDSQRLQQVLRNLITNAFKFTSEGEVVVAISRPEAELAEFAGLTADKAISFKVIDSGIGIPEEQQAAIFGAFQQADGSTSRNYGGTGLGLSISRELARLLGGAIHLESAPGEGSTFTVIVPEKLAPAPEAPREAEVPKAPEAGKTGTAERPGGQDAPSVPAAPEAGGRAAARSAGTDEQEEKKTPPPAQKGEFVEDDRKGISPEDKSLLIIEDDRHFAKVMRDFSRERGFKCLIAEDGETGLHFADYYRPSAIILDIGLPGIDGWTVMERLKNNPELRHIPVHFMSAADSSLDAMRMGAIGFLTKPVNLEKIEEAYSRIETLIEKPVGKLLLVEDDPVQRDSVSQLIGNGDVVTTAVATGGEAFEELNRGRYDCMVLDLGLEDMSGFELLEKIRLSETCSRVPIIVYTGRELTQDEEKKLSRYAESIIIKGAKSPERLLDETALFLHRVEADLPPEQRQMLKMVHDKEAVLSGKTVLLVDDDMRNVFALSSVLEEKSMDVVIARDGLECLDKLNSNGHIDLVLMDIMMPRMDGYEAMREIRKDPKFGRLPIIALTAKAMKGDRSKCIEAGASDYLAKPVNTEKLLSMLRVWLY